MLENYAIKVYLDEGRNGYSDQIFRIIGLKMAAEDSLVALISKSLDGRIWRDAF